MSFTILLEDITDERLNILIEELENIGITEFNIIDKGIRNKTFITDIIFTDLDDCDLNVICTLLMDFHFTEFEVYELLDEEQ